ncbi:hypothetical protein L7F22_044674 [Adiantum nelumboides]|nr:hypothetical protein [Adiantum nelumboides]
MAAAIQAVETGMSIRGACRHWGMGQSSLAAWLERRTITRRHGPAATLLTSEEEAPLQCCFQKQEAGHGATTQVLVLKVVELCQTRQTLFIDGIPGRSWVRGLSQCEEGATMSMQGKAWMTMQLFSTWLEHFKKMVPNGVSSEY